MSLNLLLLLAAIATALMLPPIYRAGIRHVGAWLQRDSYWQAIVLSLATILLIVASIAWLYLVFVTLSSWLTSLSPSRPKPDFLVMWFIGAFVYGFGMSFVGSLHSLALREYKKDSFWS